MIVMEDRLIHDDRLYDVPAAAAVLGMSQWWLYDQVAAGHVPHHRLGRRIRISGRQLREFLEGRIVRPVPEAIDEIVEAIIGTGAVEAPEVEVRFEGLRSVRRRSA